MKVAGGPVTLEINGQRSQEGYLRWRDYHHTYPSGQRVVYVHQLVAIADGADPYKVFSDGRYQVHHKNGVIEENADYNVELEANTDHLGYHMNGSIDTQP